MTRLTLGIYGGYIYGWTGVQTNKQKCGRKRCTSYSDSTDLLGRGTSCPKGLQGGLQKNAGGLLKGSWQKEINM
jgi:hypothetical protein